MENTEAPKKELGASCTDSSTCLSGNCVDRFCCAAASCGPCSSCGLAETRGKCSPIAAGDDADSCNGTKTCGSSAQCLSIDDQQVMSGVGVYVGEKSPHLRLAQVVTIREAGQLLELKMAWYCDKKEDSLSVTVNAVSSDGTPSAKILSNTLLYEPAVRFPLRNGEPSFDNLPLVTPFAVKAGDRLALVVQAPMITGECMLYSARMAAYAGGDQFELPVDSSTWVRRDADFVFKTLVAR